MRFLAAVKLMKGWAKCLSQFFMRDQITHTFDGELLGNLRDYNQSLDCIIVQQQNRTASTYVGWPNCRGVQR